MTNNEIVLIIYNSINIPGICYKLGIRKDIDDIQQIIYDIILHYDNNKLNNIYKNGALLSFVYICIRNQITNNKKGEWYMLNSSEYIEWDIEIDDDDYDQEKENKLQFIEDEFKTIYFNTIDKMSYKEKNEYVQKLLFKNKILKKWTLNDMRDKFKMSRNVVNNIIQNCKKSIKTKYENGYNSELP